MQRTMNGNGVSDGRLGLPALILDRQGVEALQRRLHAFGQEMVWAACYKLLRQVVAVKPYSGYYLPWDSQEDLEAFCEAEGISSEIVLLLYKANLFDYPGGGARAVISVRPGYEGPLLLLREFKSSPAEVVRFFLSGKG